MDRSGAPLADWPGTWTTNIVGLFVALGTLMLIVGPGIFTIDEQAYRFQAEVVDGGTWGLPYPTDSVIDQNLGAPISNSERGENLWYPAARHPAYIHLLRTVSPIDGFYGPVLISILGLLAAAAGIEHVARWLGGVPRWAAFWFVGLASPATFHGLVTWAHAPALGLLSVGLALMLRAGPKRRLLTLGAMAALACAVLLRSDAPLAVAAIGAGLLVPIRNDRVALFRFAATGVSGVIGLGLSIAWHGATVEPTTVAGLGTGRGVDIGRYGATALEILISPGPGLAALRLISVALFITAIWWHRRIGVDGATIAVVLAGFATAFGVAGSLHSAVYGSLVPAAPVLMVGLVGLVLVKRSTPSDQLERMLMLGVMATAATIAPIMATVSGGGGLGWGGRYVLLALAPAIPLALRGFATLLQAPATKRIAIGALVVTVAVQIAGARALVDTHSASQAVSPLLGDALPALGQEFDLIATIDPRVGRMAPGVASTTPLVSLQSAEDLDALLAIAESGGLTEVAVVSFFEPTEPNLPDGWTSLEYRDDSLRVLVVGQ